MIEGSLVQLVGKLPKGLEDAGRVGTLIWCLNKQCAVLMPNGMIFTGPSYEVILEQIENNTVQAE